MIKNCLFCKKEFNARETRSKYCSKKCYSESLKTGKTLICKICGKSFWVNKYRLDTENPQYCSTKCGCQIAKLIGKRIACIVCGKEKYISPKEFKQRKFCSKKCFYQYWRGDNHQNWKGGRRKEGQGYIIISRPNHPYSTKRGYILEHRFVMEQHIGRYLKRTEIVHHINGDKSDNRISNLILFPTAGAHSSFHHELKKAHKF